LHTQVRRQGERTDESLSPGLLDGIQDCTLVSVTNVSIIILPDPYEILFTPSLS